MPSPSGCVSGFDGRRPRAGLRTAFRFGLARLAGAGFFLFFAVAMAVPPAEGREAPA
jgi:hypothetical protein